MRETTSRHTESLSALPIHYFPPFGVRVGGHPDDFIYRPALNISEFVDLLRIPISNASEAAASTGKGKKRAASPTRPASGTTRKRAKTSSTSGGSRDNDDKLFAWATMHYPEVDAHFQSVSDHVDSIPVLSHIFEINYNSSIPRGRLSSHFASDKDWISDERNLEETLQLLRGVNEGSEFDLGTISLARHSGRIVVVSDVLEKRNDDAQWLLLLPPLLDGLDFDSFGIPSVRCEDNHDIIVACSELQAAGRVAINGQLTFTIDPEADAGFFLRVQVTVSLTPAIYSEPIRIMRKAKIPLEDAQRRLLQFVYPDATLTSHPQTVTNIPFFYSILGPAPYLQSSAVDRAMQPEALLATLLPFQRRSVAWLLDREGKMITANGQIVEKPAAQSFSFWERIEEGSKVLFVNRLTGNMSLAPPDEPAPLGAILAEEPGLGKTLEIISLLLLNPASPDRHPGVKRWDPESELEVKAVRTALIVTPPALASQWVDEMKRHAPSLKVLVYEGWTKVKVPISPGDVEKERALRLRAATRGKGKGNRQTKKGKGKGAPSEREDERELDEDEAGEDVGEVLDWCSYVQGFDVVITTYQILKTDFNVARAAPKRPRREDVVYSNVERPRSPLIMVEWNRVIMDEVQMAGGGNVEDMVSMIPRLASFAVSGTPARTQVPDLMHVLRFLRVELHPRHWARLVVPGYSAYFSAFFRRIAIRTTKASVTAELTIPQQTRFLVGIEMGRVERHVYDQNLEATLLELGLDARGVDVRGLNREPDVGLLRKSLKHLRAICTHPQIGQTGNNLFKPGALKSMEQVLQTMCDENWTTVMEDCKSKARCFFKGVSNIYSVCQIQGLIKTAQLQQHLAEKNRYQHCLETLLLAEKETTQLIEEIESAIATHETNRHLHQPQETEPDTSTPNDKGKGKERGRSLSPLSDLESDDDDDDDDQAPLKEYKTKRQALKLRSREAQLVMHRVKFLQGDTYHMLGASQSVAENAAYGEAEVIRRLILKSSEKEALDAMDVLARDATSKGLTREKLQIQVPFLACDLRGEEPLELQEEANRIIEAVLNQQSSLLWRWRGRMTELLTQQLTAGEEADGQEYQRTLDDQGEAETYLANYASLLADRREALLKERTLLAAHDAREKKFRHTKTAIKAAAALDTPLELPEDMELQPEHEVLHKNLSEMRKNFLPKLCGRAIKSVALDLAAMAGRIHKETDPQKIALKKAVLDLRRLITEQGTLLDKLEADLALYRKAFNQRIMYFRQLQEISDAVGGVDFEGTAAQALVECATAQRDFAVKINTNRARQRYLDHLSKDKGSGERDEDEETCILCKCEFICGFITQCAHVFCEECMKAWVAKRQGNTCPVCRVAINPEKLERFAVAEQAVEPKLESDPEPVPKSRRKIDYNMIGIVPRLIPRDEIQPPRADPQVLQEIQAMPSFGDYGNKIQTLVRHLSYLRTADAGAKSIVFSAWAESLYIVERALRENGISCLRIDQNRKGLTVKKFASEDIDVLLLHGERENAGLNITCASRVFLLESVVHHGFEIQGAVADHRCNCQLTQTGLIPAIARIDRMGQTRSTEVFCYYAEDTVEKNILDLAARQGTSLYTKSNSVGSMLNVSSLAGEKKVVDSPAKKNQKGDFIDKTDDMLQILFPHMSEDIEYLIPEEDMDVYVADTAPAPVNAVAGPSRIA
ncbi:SNF2 family N-terminal domain-containing protein [Mycena vitilis]|nr:SNF2 family N-terminal domain-containing protein [Mycena vitilis]